MTAEIINLRRRRKAIASAQDDAKAAQNRATHGRTKAERERERLLAEQDRQRLDRLRREDP